MPTMYDAHAFYLFIQYDSVVLLGPIGEEKPDSEPKDSLEYPKMRTFGDEGPGTDTPRGVLRMRRHY